jgi:2-methylisocitrate lyase-like PEP mutase family enzyme
MGAMWSLKLPDCRRAQVRELLVRSAGDLTLADVAALGMRRVSVGGAMARTAWGSFMRAAKAIAEQGVFDGFAGAASRAELNGLFRAKLDADAPD